MEPGPLMIYAASDSPRLRYIAGIIIGDILGLNWDLTTDKRKLGKHDVINYSDRYLKDSFRISPSSILFETGIKEREIKIGKWKDLPVFFQTSSESDIPFDIFASSFYLISRYEEYLDYEPDEHGRYRASFSFSYRNGFLEIPVIDLWAREFARRLLKKFHSLAFKKNEFKSVVTFDADEPFEYLGKSVIRSLGGLLRDLTVNDGNAGERYKTVTGGKPDSFEVFDYIIECIDRNNSDALFFFPVGDRSKYDHNPSWRNADYRSLILRLAGKYKHGIHPSFSASHSSLVMEKEVNRYNSIIANEENLSRFHYLRLKLPVSYRILLKAGIEEDYSMGYHDEPGFRAGIARPFYFYDIENETTTKLKVVPFQFMDVTMYKYKKIDSKASFEIILKLINEVRSVGGLFVTIWHNTSLLDDTDGRSWRIAFESMLNAQK